jgi:hypothetical protein
MQASQSTPVQMGTMTNLVGRSMKIDYRCAFLMWMVVVQYVMLFATVWPLVVSESSRGLVGFLQRDFQITPALVVLFLFAIGITWRGVRGRWWLLLMLSGQFIYAFGALVYAIHSDITLTQFAGHGGLFFLCMFGVISSVPLPRDPREEFLGVFKARLINSSKVLLIPTIGAALLIYALGLASRPDAGIAMFIQSQFESPVIIGILVTALSLAAAVTIQNHISASRLFIALIPQLIYAVMAVSFLSSDNNVSLAGVMVHFLFWITAMFIVLIQTKEYARALRLRQRQGA